jgi:translation initiation factor 2 alpha subunit (eIF-2alpha)
MFQVSFKGALSNAKTKTYKVIVDVDNIIESISKTAKLLDQYRSVFGLIEVIESKQVAFDHIVVPEFDPYNSYYRVVNTTITEEGKTVSESLLVYCPNNEAINTSKEFLKESSLYNSEAVAIDQATKLSIIEFVQADALELEYFKQFETEEND